MGLLIRDEVGSRQRFPLLALIEQIEAIADSPFCVEMSQVDGWGETVTKFGNMFEDGVGLGDEGRWKAVDLADLKRAATGESEYFFHIVLRTIVGGNCFFFGIFDSSGLFVDGDQDVCEFLSNDYEDVSDMGPRTKPW